MTHIPDGVLSAPVLITGALVSLGGCAWGLKILTHERIPQVAIFSSIAFISSLVHFPVGPASAHLMLNGLIGILLGLTAFPAILVALLLQAVLFGFGGVVVLGVNVMNMALSAIMCRLVMIITSRYVSISFSAGLCGALGVFLTAIMVALSLKLSGNEFVSAAKLAVFAHIPLIAIEAVFTAAVVRVLSKVRPEWF